MGSWQSESDSLEVLQQSIHRAHVAIKVTLPLHQRLIHRSVNLLCRHKSPPVAGDSSALRADGTMATGEWLETAVHHKGLSRKSPARLIGSWLWK
eukprot:s2372_g10.t1